MRILERSMSRPRSYNKVSQARDLDDWQLKDSLQVPPAVCTQQRATHKSLEVSTCNMFVNGWETHRCAHMAGCLTVSLMIWTASWLAMQSHSPSLASTWHRHASAQQMRHF